MALASGSRLGAYEILTLVGHGGMGEVYRATDTILKRQVALKFLPPEVANDPERVARFQREAEVLASLNHPNIAHLYGLERSGGTLALVMELVEGPMLADRIAKGAIPLAGGRRHANSGECTTSTRPGTSVVIEDSMHTDAPADRFSLTRLPQRPLDVRTRGRGWQSTTRPVPEYGWSAASQTPLRCLRPSEVVHSDLSTTEGSRRVARRAGM